MLFAFLSGLVRMNLQLLDITLDLGQVVLRRRTRARSSHQTAAVCRARVRSTGTGIESKVNLHYIVMYLKTMRASP